MEIISGFIMGILGSFHCLGMCGPIAMAIPPRSNNKVSIVFDSLLYNFGRTITYVVMGALVGLVGTSLSLAGYQEVASIVAGVGLLAFVVMPKKWQSSVLSIPAINRLSIRFKKLFGKVILKKTIGSLIAMGLLNGLLPCGLVYMALTASLAYGSFGGAIIFMLFFGIGTIPMMASIFVLKSVVSLGIRRKINKLIPVGITIVALILILRGMSLGIPLISPVLPDHVKGKPACCGEDVK